MVITPLMVGAAFWVTMPPRANDAGAVLGEPVSVVRQGGYIGAVGAAQLPIGRIPVPTFPT